MKIVVAPDSFKGSLTAAQACAAIVAGVRKLNPAYEMIPAPMADGGEGTVQSLIDGLTGTFVTCSVADPLGRLVTARYGITSGGTAVIEMAEASGLPLLATDERDPLLTSTFGTGQLIKDALDRGVRDFILGIGGSATNDGGAGLAQALGFRLLDAGGSELPKGGVALRRLVSIDDKQADARLNQCRFTVACDVDNPLLGSHGASFVFGPQKGATPETVALLDDALTCFAACICRDLGKDIAEIPGAGAAGGLGAGCIAFLDAELKRGVDIVIEVTGLREKLLGADLVITGEGRTDEQTLSGKTIHGVARLSKSCGVPVLVLSGSIGSGAEALKEDGVYGLYGIMDEGVTLEASIRNGAELLENLAFRAVRGFLEKEV